MCLYLVVHENALFFKQRFHQLICGNLSLLINMFIYLNWWFGVCALDSWESSYERECYLGVPRSNPNPIKQNPWVDEHCRAFFSPICLSIVVFRMWPSTVCVFFPLSIFWTATPPAKKKHKKTRCFCRWIGGRSHTLNARKTTTAKPWTSGGQLFESTRNIGGFGIIYRLRPTWRIIPFSKWLVAMVNKSPNLGLFPFQMA